MKTNQLSINTKELLPSLLKSYGFLELTIPHSELYKDPTSLRKDKAFQHVLAAVPDGTGEYSPDKGNCPVKVKWILMYPANKVSDAILHLKDRYCSVQIKSSTPSIAKLFELLARSRHTRLRDKQDLFAKELILDVSNPKGKRQIRDYYILKVEQGLAADRIVVDIHSKKAIKGSEVQKIANWSKKSWAKVGYHFNRDADYKGYFSPQPSEKDTKEPNKAFWYLGPSLLYNATPLVFLDLSAKALPTDPTDDDKKKRADQLKDNLSKSRVILLQNEIDGVIHEFDPEGKSIRYEEESECIHKIDDSSYANVMQHPSRLKNPGVAAVASLAELLANHTIYLTCLPDDPDGYKFLEKEVKPAIENMFQGGKGYKKLQTHLGTGKAAVKVNIVVTNGTDIVDDNPLVLCMIPAGKEEYSPTNDPYLLCEDHWVTQHVTQTNLKELVNDAKKNPEVLLLKCLNELVFKYNLRIGKDSLAEFYQTSGVKSAWFIKKCQPYSEDQKARKKLPYTQIAAAKIDFETGTMSTLFEPDHAHSLPKEAADLLKSDPQNPMVIYDEEGGTIFKVTSTNIRVLLDKDTLFDFVDREKNNGGGCQIRNKQNFSLIDDILDIHFAYDPDANKGCYSSGCRHTKINTKIQKGPLIRLVEACGGNMTIEDFKDTFLNLLYINQITSDEKFTVLPYPFKYVNELIKLEELNARKKAASAPAPFIP